MKKYLIVIAALSALAALPGCNHRNDVHSAAATGQAEELKAMQQSYRGVLPCADCSGIETTLFLEKDGTWMMNERYQDGKGDSEFASWGTWARTADRLVLTDTQGEKRYFRPKGEDIEMLDREGHPITSQLDYTLKATDATLPATPMPMRGMYFYMADAAVFTECATGKRVNVQNNAQLERAYAQAKGEATAPVLLEVKGHFALTANEDTGAPEKTLVTDGNGTFLAGKRCNDDASRPSR